MKLDYGEFALLHLLWLLLLISEYNLCRKRCFKSCCQWPTRIRSHAM